MSERQRMLDRATELERGTEPWMRDRAGQLRQRVEIFDEKPGAWATLDAHEAHAAQQTRRDAATMCSCDPVTRECSCEPWRLSYANTQSKKEDTQMDAREQMIEQRRRMAHTDAADTNHGYADAREAMIAQRRALSQTMDSTHEHTDAREPEPADAREAMIAQRRAMCR